MLVVISFCCVFGGFFVIVFIVLLLFFDLSKGEIYLTILSNLVVIGFVVEYDFFVVLFIFIDS